MTTVKHPHSKSTAAKIRRLILRGMTNKDIVDKLTCSYGYVSTIRSKMKTQSQSGIASLPTVTAPPGDTSEMVYQISRGRGRPRKNLPHPAMNSFIPEQELADALSKVEDGMIERRHLKQSFFAIAAMTLLLVAALAYTFAK